MFFKDECFEAILSGFPEFDFYFFMFVACCLDRVEIVLKVVSFSRIFKM